MSHDIKKVFYVCFYSDKEIEDKIIVYPSVIPKIDYVKSKLKKLGYKVEIVSISVSKNGAFRGYKKKADDFENHVFLPSSNRKNKIARKINTFIRWNNIIKYLHCHVGKDDKILVYHSLYNRYWMKKLCDKFKKKVVLEIEDVFSELSKENEKFKKDEWNTFNAASAYICINDLVYDKLPKEKPKIISYGSYNVPQDHGIVKTDKIKVVYAGVIEQNRNAAFLAVQAAEYLSNNYEVHILGFGNEDDISALEALIKKVNTLTNREAVFFDGMKKGTEYEEFLQGCNIALSTHAYDKNSISSADNTFPSKILVYLSNDLSVIAQRLEVLEKSSISEYIGFYENPTPKEIAEAIIKTDLSENNGRQKIKEMDISFEKGLKKLLDEI